jgi:hypothetical protein
MSVLPKARASRPEQGCDRSTRCPRQLAADPQLAVKFDELVKPEEAELA